MLVSFDRRGLSLPHVPGSHEVSVVTLAICVGSILQRQTATPVSSWTIYLHVSPLSDNIIKSCSGSAPEDLVEGSHELVSVKCTLNTVFAVDTPTVVTLPISLENCWPGWTKFTT